MLRTGRARAPVALSASTRLALARLEAPPRRGQGKRGARPTLALVTPLPPDRTGIAAYVASLLPPLARNYDITVVTASAGVPRPGFPHPIVSEEWFLENGAGFDRVLYHFGNSPFHLGMIGLLEQRPGVVMLHDFSLGDMGLTLNGPLYDHWWARTLYDSHGYAACREFASGRPASELVVRYPCSGFVFTNSVGVLVHSRFALQLAERFYGPVAASRTQIVPFAQTLRGGDRGAARQRLGLREEELLVCSFGFAGRAKLTHRLIDAWTQADLATAGRLVIVGQLPADDYGRAIAERIRSSPNARVSVTGYADPALFEDYLSAADIAVQLRGETRGETSGAVFDSLAAGLPVIVNAHGALAEAPAEAVLALPDRFTDADLVSALRQLAGDEARRRRMGLAGRRIVAERHDPAAVGEAYSYHLERFFATAVPLHDPARLAAARAEAAGAGRGAAALDGAATKIAAASGPWPRLRCLYLDVTAIAGHDLGTGIQRVVRAQLLELLAAPPAGYRIEPVRLEGEGDRMLLVHARTYASRLLDLPLHWLADDPVEPQEGDVYYIPDLAPDAVARAARTGLFTNLRQAGTSIHVLVHDLLPITHPMFFPSSAPGPHRAWLEAVVTEADQLICISDAVRDELNAWLAVNRPEAAGRPQVSVLPHGADLEAAADMRPGEGAPAELADAMNLRPTFVMVGTLEPRKGHLQALAAFDALWEDGFDANLVIVGAEGWRGLPAAERRDIVRAVAHIRASPELGRRLFWLPQADDRALSDVLQSATCLLSASWGEGFGLPLIEAARRGLPILVRDLPVFREVAGAHAAYFEAATAVELAQAITAWTDRWRRGVHPSSLGLPHLTWAENVGRLKRLLIDHDRASRGAAASLFS